MSTSRMFLKILSVLTISSGLLVLGCFDQPYRLAKIKPGLQWSEDNVEVVKKEEVPENKKYCELRMSEAEYRDPSTTIEIKKGSNGKTQYWLGFIEIDDQGQFWSEKQRDYVLDELVEYADKEPVIMLLYVHGFQHNAHVCDEKIRHLRTQLKNLHNRELELVAEGKAKKARKIIGVTIGWRGKSGKVANYATFGERKRGAHRVGDRAGLQVLSRLNEIDQQFKADNPSSRMVVVGHSLGAAVLMSAIHARLEELLIQLALPKEERRLGTDVGVGDLVVFLNPAFEALRFRQIVRLSKKLKDYDDPPLILSISTRKDYVTRIAFATAMSFWFKKGMFRDPAEEEEFKTSLGNYKPYHTHTISEADLQDCPVAAMKPYLEFGRSDDPTEDDEIAAEQKAKLEKKSEKCIKPGTIKNFKRPYLSVYDEDGSLMTGHNNENNPRVAKFIADFIHGAKILAPEQAPSHDYMEQQAAQIQMIMVPNRPPLEHPIPSPPPSPPPDSKLEEPEPAPEEAETP